MLQSILTTHLYVAYGIASAAALGFAALCACEDRNERIAMALMLGFSWAASNQFYFAETEVMYLLCDAFIFFAVGAMWVDRPARWKSAIALTSLMGLGFHVIYQAALAAGIHMGYCYRAALNALFVCQLLAVSNTGVRRGLDLLHGGFRSYSSRWVLRVYGMARARP